jgi:ABC-type multidrug transport system fused ATPase/permease subunit
LLIIEGFSGISGFLGFTNWLVPDTIYMLTWQIVGFGISLMLWLFVIFFTDNNPAAAPGEITGRGSIVFNSARIYFFVTTVIHGFLMVAWIVWRANFGALSPPFTFTNNFGPLVVLFQISLAQFIVLFVALFFFIYDIRNQSTAKAFRTIERANAAVNAKFAEAFSTAH